MREMDGKFDVPHAVWVFSHGPLGLHTQPFPRYVMPGAKSTNKITDTTRKRPDEQFDGAEAGVLAAVLDRLIGDDSMRSTNDVVARPAVI